MQENNQMNIEKFSSEQFKQIAIESIFNDISYIIFWKNRDLIYMGGNDAFVKLLDLESPQSFIGKTDAQLGFYETDPGLCNAGDQEVLNGKSRLNVEEVIIHPNQKHTVVLISKIPLRDKNHNIIGVMSIGSDITKRKKEEQLFLQEIISRMPGYVFWKNRKHVYLGCNDYLVKMAGLKTRADFIGKTDYELPWAAHAAAFQKDDSEVMESGRAKLDIEEKLVHTDGSVSTVLTNKVPLHDDDGKVTGILAISTDITNRKRMEQEIKEAKEKAEDASRAKSGFISNMSHDIRSPLASMYNASKRLEEDIQTESDKEQAHILVRSSKQLLSLLTDILDTIKSGNEDTLYLETFNLKKMIQDLCEIYFLNAKEKKLEIKTSIAADVPEYVVSDRIKLSRVLFNMLGNAIKFTDKGDIEIKVECENKNDENVTLKFSVKDTGIGIADEFQSKVFDLFSRENPANKNIYTGYGIGMNMAKNFVTALGSKINLISKKGQGTTFYFDIVMQNGKAEDVKNTALVDAMPAMLAPLKEMEKDARIENVRSDSEAAAESSLAPTVLLVEDSSVLMAFNRHFLKKAGFLTLVATTGEEALKLAKTEKYHIVLTDLGLPGISGDEFTALLRHWERISGKNPVPVVAYTGNGNDPDVKKTCLFAGMNAILTKPVDPTVLANLLNELLSPAEKNNSNTVVSLTGIDAAIKNAPVVSVASLGYELPETEDELFQLDQYLLLDDKELGKDEIEMLPFLISEMIPNELADLVKAHDEKDGAQIEFVCHRMKGGALAFHALRMKQASQYLERYHRAGHRNPEIIEKLYQQLVQVLSDTKDYVEKLLAAEKKGGVL